MNKPLNQYSKKELEEMHFHGNLDICPKCKKYHNPKKAIWPYTNVSVCLNCKRVLDLSILDEWKKEKVNDKGIK